MTRKCNKCEGDLEILRIDSDGKTTDVQVKCKQCGFVDVHHFDNGAGFKGYVST